MTSTPTPTLIETSSLPASSLIDAPNVEDKDRQNEKDKDGDNVSVGGSSYSGRSYVDHSLADRSGTPARPAYVDPVVAEQEERQVKRSRLVVIAVLIVSLAILASTMYLIVSRGEYETFQKQVSPIEILGVSCCLML